MSLLRKVLRLLTYLSGLILLFILVSNIWVVSSTYSHVYNSIGKLPIGQVGLVLGTTSKLRSGEENPYFVERINTAAELYKEGKIEHLLLSGDNETIYYNEPAKMREALLEKGIPDADITLDYAGFRTLDSVVRCKEIFGQEKITIITQQFHSYRALFISNYYAIDAIAISAQNTSFPSSLQVTLREFIARPMAVIDLYILKTSPKFLGNKEYI